MSLSICLLTRDAMPQVERAIRSVAALGAQIVVGDTGSRDETVAAVKAMGAAVCVIPWQDDFAAAQNQVLDVATGDWVLWLNPNEELISVGPEPPAALMARPEALAYLIRVQEVTRPDQVDGAVEIWLPRLFRRHAEVRFAGRIHPHFAPPLEEVARRRSMEIYRTDVLLRRHAYLSVLTKGKLRWAARLLELELHDRPGQLHYLIEYGRNLLRLNDPRGHAVLAEATELTMTAAEAPRPPSPTVASLLEYLLSVAPEQSRSRLTPEQAGALALRWFPAAAPLLWAMGQRAYQSGAFVEAAGLLERLIHLGRTGAYDRSAAFDPSIMAEPALLNLGHCCLRLGDLDRAESCFGQALANPTHRTAAQQGLAMVQAQRRRAAAPRGS
jgi:Glycosyl transferase family 2/Tetratricopeptide repeat